MEHDHLPLVRATVSRARRTRRTTGRILFSAAGFGLAYLFDAENGAARRARLRRSLHHATSTRYSVLAPVTGVHDAPPVFGPLLRGLGEEDVGSWARRRSAAS